MRQLRFASFDPQLDGAITEAMRLLKEHPPSAPKPPQNPDRSQKQ